MNKNDYIIKYVAVYLRKSRGEDETVLSKHQLELTELCKANNWTYIEYKEVESGDSIEMRPIFKQLLSDIENDMFDGVVVIDIDRLGRGNQADQGRINQIFISTSTLIITPQQIYNLENEDDEFVVDVKGFIARREYKLIVKRLNRGKKIGSKMGNWTNGTPPYPYEYEHYNDKYNPKGLVVNDEKLKIYRFMVDSMLNNGMTPQQIAVELNRKAVPSPKQSYWHSFTVHRILMDKTHLGNIIANKTKGDGHAKKKPNSKPVEYIPQDNWLVVHNCHEAVKTQEEHEQILAFIYRNLKAPKRTQNIIQPLSGLIKCAKCNHTMGVYKRKDKNNLTDVLRPCWYIDNYGNKCNNSGMKLDLLYNYIDHEVDEYLEKLIKDLRDTNINESKLILKQKIDNITDEINTKTKTLDRMLDGYENGVYSLNQYKERKSKIDLSIEKLVQERDILNNQYDKFNENTIEEKIKKIQYFKVNIKADGITDEEKNRYYKSIIDYIKWGRNKDEINIEIHYL
jgi:DNA invertase Pin-like site-specific DNA recombinase